MQWPYSNNIGMCVNYCQLTLTLNLYPITHQYTLAIPVQVTFPLYISPGSILYQTVQVTLCPISHQAVYSSYTSTSDLGVFHLWLRIITFGGRSSHLAYHVHTSGRKTSITNQSLQQTPYVSILRDMTATFTISY